MQQIKYKKREVSKQKYFLLWITKFHSNSVSLVLHKGPWSPLG